MSSLAKQKEWNGADASEQAEESVEVYHRLAGGDSLSIEEYGGGANSGSKKEASDPRMQREDKESLTKADREFMSSKKRPSCRSVLVLRWPSLNKSREKYIRFVSGRPLCQPLLVTWVEV